MCFLVTVFNIWQILTSAYSLNRLKINIFPLCITLFNPSSKVDFSFTTSTFFFQLWDSCLRENTCNTRWYVQFKTKAGVSIRRCLCPSVRSQQWTTSSFVWGDGPEHWIKNYSPPTVNIPATQSEPFEPKSGIWWM